MTTTKPIDLGYPSREQYFTSAQEVREYVKEIFPRPWNMQTKTKDKVVQIYCKCKGVKLNCSNCKSGWHITSFSSGLDTHTPSCDKRFDQTSQTAMTPWSQFKPQISAQVRNKVMLNTHRRIILHDISTQFKELKIFDDAAIYSEIHDLIAREKRVVSRQRISDVNRSVQQHSELDLTIELHNIGATMAVFHTAAIKHFNKYNHCMMLGGVAKVSYTRRGSQPFIVFGVDGAMKTFPIAWLWSTGEESPGTRHWFLNLLSTRLTAQPKTVVAPLGLLDSKCPDVFSGSQRLLCLWSLALHWTVETRSGNLTTFWNLALLEDPSQFEALREHAIATYPLAKDWLEEVIARKSEWVQCFVDEAVPCGSVTLVRSCQRAERFYESLKTRISPGSISEVARNICDTFISNLRASLKKENSHGSTTTSVISKMSQSLLSITVPATTPHVAVDNLADISQLTQGQQIEHKEAELETMRRDVTRTHTKALLPPLDLCDAEDDLGQMPGAGRRVAVICKGLSPNNKGKPASLCDVVKQYCQRESYVSHVAQLLTSYQDLVPPLPDVGLPGLPGEVEESIENFLQKDLRSALYQKPVLMDVFKVIIRSHDIPLTVEPIVPPIAVPPASATAPQTNIPAPAPAGEGSASFAKIPSARAEHVQL
eukprot:gnl/Dysnectes_brevis/7939_a13769_192.p1 GENE.gnl/Dysnectes_brevis/7939_a13769_192~~gnl/Dysnectes_brevis/7939_a13769_192.p1  ORF type:complete len:663 (-),score=130.64 gnl/Dysnectes_brevis/7939_a13769_192:70-2028(-)